MSFVYLEQESILVMDTQGLQSPVDHTDQCIEDALVQMQNKAAKAFLRQLPSTDLMHAVVEAEKTLKKLTQPETFEPYDVIVRLTNLAEFVRLKEIPVLTRSGSTFDVNKRTRCRVVAVAGFFNKGKTWLVNQIFGRHLGSSKTLATEGMLNPKSTRSITVSTTMQTPCGVAFFQHPRRQKAAAVSTAVCHLQVCVSSRRHLQIGRMTL